MVKQRDVTNEEATTFAEENGLIFLEASAKTYVAHVHQNCGGSASVTCRAG